MSLMWSSQRSRTKSDDGFRTRLIPAGRHTWLRARRRQRLQNEVPLSLRARLTIFFSLSSGAILLGLGVLTACSVDQVFADEDYAVLGDNIRRIQEIVAESQTKSIPARLGETLGQYPGLVVNVRAVDGSSVHASKGFDFSTAFDAMAKLGPDRNTFVFKQDGKVYRGMRAIAPATGVQPAPLRIVVGMDTHLHTPSLRAFRMSLACYFALAVFVSGMFGWWAARRGLAPLHSMASRARALTSHKLDERMPVHALPVELGNLVATVNAMLERVQYDFGRLSDFSSGLAHELRTPITNLMLQTQVALSQPRDADEYREVLESNAEELQRLTQMLSDMLYLAKIEHGITLPNVEAINAADEVLSLFDFYDALAEDKGIHLHFDGQGKVTGDRLMLRRALSNLLSNALRYTPTGKEVRVQACEQGGSTSIVVQNDGEISPELLPLVFDRFFRADKSRTHADSDSVGLGLSITRAIMVAHGGEISAESSDGITRFILTFRGTGL
ncbi:heavy metal sensor histidine kinase [Cupriavidus taiwanensis]|uniref:heavy metal sensor histidine kinase n=1 Tax=Cupriavidus taiwanensis TaxID=164546 RepID=UPI000E19A53F|nr:heavy metal sensor histidine kinase [Cupriavidus taiwanensis]SOY44502.1 ATPase [Cupriavidus taiwanensis]